jgi:hypothetical protein
MSSNDLCNVYANNVLLKGARSPADLQAIAVYCPFAQSRPYGPNPPAERVMESAGCSCPYGYGFNSNAYNFSAGPSYINLNQSLNMQKLNGQVPLFRGAPVGPSFRNQ